MTAIPQQPWTQPSPPRRWGAGRVVALVIGIVLLLPAVGLLLGGGVLLWADRSHRSGGYLVSDSASFSSGGFALTSDRIDLSTGTKWVPVSAALGTARLQVTGTDPGRALFVGIASTADASAYLSGVRRTVVNDIGTGSAAETVEPGGAPSGPPGDQTFWVARASGPGTQSLTWSPENGNWTLVVMNGDGSAGVSVQARIGATAPGLPGLAWTLIGVGLAVAGIGILLIVLAVRRPAAPAAPPAGPPAAPAPAAPPPWAAPAPRASTEPASPDGVRTTPPPVPGQPAG
jgi:hypothetical protein